jgi:hypothetical protein
VDYSARVAAASDVSIQSCSHGNLLDTHARSFEVSQPAATNLQQSVSKTTYKMEIRPKYTVTKTSQEEEEKLSTKKKREF